MKSYITSLLLTLLFTTSGFSQEEKTKPGKNTPQEVAARLSESSEALAEAQDELSADVMELVESQTVAGVIELLEEVEKIMAEVTDDLIEGETGGSTMAAQTEIIEKILAAAKKKQQSSGEESKESKESTGAMLDMMERMMGKEPGEKEGEGPPQEGGKKPGDKGDGGGSTGDSDTANEQAKGKIDGETVERIIPKGSAPSGRSLPNEFRKLLDAYNKNQPSNK